MEILQLENCNILVKNNNGEIDNILPFGFVLKHPTESEAILISNSTDKEDERAGITIYCSEVTKVNDVDFSGSETDLLELLSTEIIFSGNCNTCSDQSKTIPPTIEPIDDITLFLEETGGVLSKSHQLNVVINDEDSNTDQLTKSWKLISGPGTANIVDDNFTFLEEGTYIFTITVTDESDNKAFETVTFNIKPKEVVSFTIKTKSNQSDYWIALKSINAINLEVNHGISNTNRTDSFNLEAVSIQHIFIDLSYNTLNEEVELVFNNAENIFHISTPTDRELFELNVTELINLELISCNQSKLTSLDVSQNPALTWLQCFQNEITSLDVSQNPALVLLWCQSNSLKTLNIANGNNALIIGFQSEINPLLTCVQVDDVTVANNNPNLVKGLDEINGQFFSTSCPVPINRSLTRE